MRIRATEPYNFGFQLLDMLFTREELAKSLLYKTKKSDKPALDAAKVERLIFLVNKRYKSKDDWDENALVKKLNQKCRDSVQKVKQEKEETNSQEKTGIPELITDESDEDPED